VAEAKKKNTTRRPGVALNDTQWALIEKTLPDTADQTSFRNRLEQFAYARWTPEQEAVQCEDIARQCDELALRLPKGQAAVLEQHSSAMKERASACHQIGKIKRPHFFRQCLLLRVWEKEGGDLYYSSAPRKRRDESTWQLPHGSVIEYLQATTKEFLGKPIRAWQAQNIVSEYKTLNFSAAIEAAQLCAFSFEPGQQLRVHIDESQIFILREGKLLRADEENLPENQPEVLRAAREAKSRV